MSANSKGSDETELMSRSTWAFSRCLYDKFPFLMCWLICSQSATLKHKQHLFQLFVLRLYDPVNPMGSCRALSIYLTTLLLGRLSPLVRLNSIVHIILPESDNCPSWLCDRERRTIENISWSFSTIECWRPGGRQFCNLMITSWLGI